MTAVSDRIGGDRPVFSVEFFPPRDDAGESALWRAVRELESTDPAFVSVTYGAGGSSRDRKPYQQPAPAEPELSPAAA